MATATAYHACMALNQAASDMPCFKGLVISITDEHGTTNPITLNELRDAGVVMSVPPTVERDPANRLQVAY